VRNKEGKDRDRKGEMEKGSKDGRKRRNERRKEIKKVEKCILLKLHTSEQHEI
jgi:hypothetical protein